jgi:hypothetical protein
MILIVRVHVHVVVLGHCRLLGAGLLGRLDAESLVKDALLGLASSELQKLACESSWSDGGGEVASASCADVLLDIPEAKIAHPSASRRRSTPAKSQ